MSSNAKVEAILVNLPLFSAMNPEEIKHIAKGSRMLNVARGEVLFQRGDIPHGFYVVIYGQIKLAFSSPEGAEKVVNLISPGKTFGEAVMFMELPYPVYSQALADSLLLHISKNVVFDGIAQHPEFSRKLLAGLSSRLHSLIGDVESYSLRSSAQRVIGYILQHDIDSPLDKSQHHFVLPANKTIIASRLNISPETFSRILHDLSAAGLINVKGKDITILDTEKLRAYGQQ